MYLISMPEGKVVEMNLLFDDGSDTMTVVT
jgi:hypothetical protein